MPSLNYENFAENLKMPCLKFLLTVKYCCCLTLVTQIDPLHCCFPSILYLCPTVVKTVKLSSLRCLALYYTPLHDAVISRKQSILDDYMYFYLNMKCYMLPSFLLSCSLISMLMSYCTCYIWVTVCGLCVDPLLCPTPRCDPILHSGHLSEVAVALYVLQLTFSPQASSHWVSCCVLSKVTLRFGHIYWPLQLTVLKAQHYWL